MRIAVWFHLPTAFNDGQQIHPFTIERLINDIINLVGGITVLYGEGGWIHPEHGLIREPILRILAATPDDLVEELVEELHRRIKNEFGQDAVYIEVDGVPSIR